MKSQFRVVIGSDEAGFAYKKVLKADLEADPRVSSVIDVAVGDDADKTAYPSIGVAAAEKVVAGEADRGLLLCGTGLGVAISANKVKGIRAVTAHDAYSVERGVLSNNAQVLCMGQRVIGRELTRKLTDEWLKHEFDPSSASVAKVGAITSYEDTDSCD
ncbi:ribose-5-phosphate isomerase [Nesterenkonia halotolerans]|uniref:Ribose 5-phosphate isomerase B n=1 Tax=Nesterenkonia halotolerans TaxID=225325 RepID=A0ABR9J6X9_9MICC|nr:ribose-5-phosphate isomerase [Nesterenkonia halotolerans]MBE1514763.1 ribose 5-phosphate isomerase B [Nesterenkonia halotolerans]